MLAKRKRRQLQLLQECLDNCCMNKFKTDNMKSKKIISHFLVIFGTILLVYACGEKHNETSNLSDAEKRHAESIREDSIFSAVKAKLQGTWNFEGEMPCKETGSKEKVHIRMKVVFEGDNYTAYYSNGTEEMKQECSGTWKFFLYDQMKEEGYTEWNIDITECPILNNRALVYKTKTDCLNWHYALNGGYTGGDCDFNGCMVKGEGK